jgi:hypothetical protein
MAFLKRCGNRFRVIFRHTGRRYTHTLKTDNPAIAQGLKGRIERTLMLIDPKMLKVPQGVEVLPFIVGSGRRDVPRSEFHYGHSRAIPRD